MTSFHRWPQPRQVCHAYRRGLKNGGEMSDFPTSEIPDTRIVFYDGYCVLCHRLVDFIISRDPMGRFRFASLQSETASRVLPRTGYPEESIKDFNNIVYLRNSELKVKSDAVLSILWDLGGFYRAGCLTYCFPRVVRNFVYDYLAHRRYRWFGKRAACRIPRSEEASRFLE